jgi:hypothetical protein
MVKYECYFVSNLRLFYATNEREGGELAHAR